ncbi:MAG: uroporphyrinogen-III synthase [Candidatus Acidiferrales bacterium]
MRDAGLLAGKRVVVTRAIEQAEELVKRLEELGAEVLHAPSVRFEAPLDSTRLDEGLRSLSSFDWLIFTSQNTVRFVASRIVELGLSVATLRAVAPKIAAVGEATAATSRAAGFDVTYVASRSSGEALAKELSDRLTGRSVLLPRSDRARPELPSALRAAGAEVTEVVAYRTLDAPLAESGQLEEIRSGEVDAIVFASPSAFDSMADALGTAELRRIGERAAVAAIGPVTAEAIREAGLTVRITAKEPSAAGLAAAIADYFEQQRVKSGAAAR